MNTQESPNDLSPEAIDGQRAAIRAGLEALERKQLKGFAWHVGSDISAEAEALRKQYEQCPTEDIPESAQKRWLALVGLGAFSLRDLSAGIPGPPAQAQTAKPSDDPYEFRLTSYMSIRSGLQPLKAWKLEDQTPATLIDIIRNQRKHDIRQREQIRDLEAVITKRNQQRRELSHELRLIRYIVKLLGAKNGQGVDRAKDGLRQMLFDEHARGQTSGYDVAKVELDAMRAQRDAALKDSRALAAEVEALKAALELAKLTGNELVERNGNLVERVVAVDREQESWRQTARLESEEHDKTKGRLEAYQTELSVLRNDHARLQENLSSETQNSRNWRAAVVRAEETEKTLRVEISQLVDERNRARERAQACTYTQQEVRELESIKEAREDAERELERTQKLLRETASTCGELRMKVEHLEREGKRLKEVQKVAAETLQRAVVAIGATEIYGEQRGREVAAAIEARQVTRCDRVYPLDPATAEDPCPVCLQDERRHPIGPRRV